MELPAATAAAYLRHAFRQVLAVAERLGEDRVNRQPLGPGTNAVGSLIVHCCGVTEFWLGHVVLGRPSDRDREAEFTRHLTIARLSDLVETTVRTAVADLERIDAGEGRAGDPEDERQWLPEGHRSDASVVLHVLEELFQHLGHMEIAADALR